MPQRSARRPPGQHPWQRGKENTTAKMRASDGDGGDRVTSSAAAVQKVSWAEGGEGVKRPGY